jgi:hypothetical protein
VYLFTDGLATVWVALIVVNSEFGRMSKEATWPSFGVLSWHVSGRFEENPKNLIRYSLSPNRDLNLDTKQNVTHSAATSGELYKEIRYNFKCMKLRTSQQFLDHWAGCAGETYRSNADIAVTPLVAWLSPRRPIFSPRVGVAEFTADRVTLGQIYFSHYDFPLPIIIPSLLHALYLNAW